MSNTEFTEAIISRLDEAGLMVVDRANVVIVNNAIAAVVEDYIANNLNANPNIPDSFKQAILMLATLCSVNWEKRKEQSTGAT